MTLKISILLVSILIISSLSTTNAQMYWEKLFDSLSYKSYEKPAPRRDSAIGFDFDRNRVIIFGGWQTNSENMGPDSPFMIPVLFDDTWEFNLITSNQPKPFI